MARSGRDEEVVRGGEQDHITRRVVGRHEDVTSTLLVVVRVDEHCDVEVSLIGRSRKSPSHSRRQTASKSRTRLGSALGSGVGSHTKVAPSTHESSSSRERASRVSERAMALHVKTEPEREVSGSRWAGYGRLTGGWDGSPTCTDPRWYSGTPAHEE